MSFIAVLLALLIEQVRPLPHNSWSSDVLRSWADWAGQNFDAGRERHAWVVLGVTIVLPTLLVALAYGLLARFSSVLALLFSVSVLYVTLGFRHFSHYFTDIRKAMERGEDRTARQLLGEWLRIDTADLPHTELLRHVLEHSLLAAHRHVFGVFFWFIVCAAIGLGPAGAVLYRLSEFADRHWSSRDPVLGEPRSVKLALRAQQVFAWLDHVPARLTAFGFAVVGDFESAIESWRRCAPMWRRSNDGVILASAAGAVGVRLGDGAAAADTPDLFTAVDTEAGALLGGQTSTSEGQTPGAPAVLAHLHSVVGLVWRSVLLWMFLLVMVTLANLAG